MSVKVRVNGIWSQQWRTTVDNHSGPFLGGVESPPLPEQANANGIGVGEVIKEGEGVGIGGDHELLVLQ